MGSKAKLRHKNVDHEVNDSQTKNKTEDGKQSKVLNVQPIANQENPNHLIIDYKRIGLRCLVIIFIIAVVSINQNEYMECFASEKEEIGKKAETVACSQDYAIELNEFPGCVPTHCGRMVSDTVVTLSEVQALLIIAEKGFSLGGSAGGASILDLHSGALSQGNSFVNIYKIDKSHKVINQQDFQLYRHVKNKIKRAIVEHFGLSDKNLYLTHPTFFSRITAIPAQTIHDEYWHPHVDKETYSSFHYTSLLYLVNYGHHFKGGRFVFVENPSNKTVEPKAGRLSAFTSGSENLHFVEKVTSGTRYAITVSFTCDPKHAITDPMIEVKS